MGIIGLGLIGGSLARALVAAGVPVIATDPSDDARTAARAAGMQIADDVATLCGNHPSMVVLAVPLRAMRVVAGEVSAALDDAPGWDPTVVDVGSVKGPVRDAIRDAGLAGRYVGAHPMAGTEHSGFDASFPDLLRGIRWVVTVDPGATRLGDGVPTSGKATDPDRLAGVLRLITAELGGTAAVLTDDAHDEAAALVSHVPHVLAGELLGLVAGAPVRDVALGLAAGSFRDGTRVAYGDPRRTEAMVTQNAAWVAPALRLAARDLEMLADALDSNAPTGWFFDRPEPLRDRRPRQTNGRTPGGVPEIPLRETAPPPEQRVPLEGDWPAELVERCSVGAVVVLMERETAVLT
ncbi:prephenate dehydrogenase [Myceligenerans pegani]|uniref:prephenate dehydrogenase n=1 Tax=Myceligenerans pegani TaxID=2776917 RepID=UPI00299F3FCE|nr:prephenate dehydrogenase/arogenate dehydrogenase family protein [Myceligenerans sp. TRM 65318]